MGRKTLQASRQGTSAARPEGGKGLESAEVEDAGQRGMAKVCRRPLPERRRLKETMSLEPSDERPREIEDTTRSGGVLRWRWPLGRMPRGPSLGLKGKPKRRSGKDYLRRRWLGKRMEYSRHMPLGFWRIFVIVLRSISNTIKGRHDTPCRLVGRKVNEELMKLTCLPLYVMSLAFERRSLVIILC